MNWRLATSLETLRAQLDAAYPDRSKVSDGSIGDSSHSARVSDHNPDAQGRVCAIDVTNDPLGPTGHVLSRQLIQDSRAKYVIFAGEIWKARTAQWETYRGPNQHNHHVHISVKAESADDVSPWKLNGAPEVKPEKPVLKLGSKGQDVRILQSQLRMSGYSVAIDGAFGKITESNLKAFQSKHGLTVDGVCGSACWAILDG